MLNHISLLLNFSPSPLDQLQGHLVCTDFFFFFTIYIVMEWGLASWSLPSNWTPCSIHPMCVLPEPSGMVPMPHATGLSYTFSLKWLLINSVCFHQRKTKKKNKQKKTKPLQTEHTTLKKIMKSSCNSDCSSPSVHMQVTYSSLEVSVAQMPASQCPGCKTVQCDNALPKAEMCSKSNATSLS